MINSSVECFAIDLGTEFIRSAVHNGSVVVLPQGDGQLSCYAYVSFEQDQQIGNYRMMGAPAYPRILKNTRNVAYGFKQLLGRDRYDKWINQNVKKWPQHIAIMDGTSPQISIQADKKWYNLEQIAAMLFQRVAQPAQQYFTPRSVVLTVPLTYNTKQRQAMKRVASYAHLNCERLIDESTAGLVAYHQLLKLQGNVLCVKIGLQFSEICMAELSQSSIHVQSCRNISLNVEYYLQAISQIYINSIDADRRQNILHHFRTMRRIYNSARRVLRVLNKSTEAQMQIDSLYQGEDLEIRIFRNNLEILTQNGRQLLQNAILEIVTESGLQPSYVVLMGGGAHIPSIMASVQKILPQSTVLTTLDVDCVAVMGAAIYFRQLERSKKQNSLIVMSLTAHHYWIRKDMEEPRILIKQSEPYPTERKVVVKMQQNQELSIQVFQQYTVLTFHHRSQTECQLELAFTLDVNRIMSVSAFDKMAFASLKLTRQEGVSREQDVFKTPEKITYLDDID